MRAGPGEAPFPGALRSMPVPDGGSVFDPIGRGRRGPAVEDVQKRLLSLGFTVGPTGVDGVFGEATRDAVRSFQVEQGLKADGVVGEATWAALVDATFQLGDRLLYLRYPYFHGADVHTLQGALNVLGFACGGPDGIFGTFTEGAVGEFQANTGLPVDGIVGPDTVRALNRLRHVWKDKDPTSPAELTVVAARAAEVLRRFTIVVVSEGGLAEAVAVRVVNLALAAEPESRLMQGASNTAHDADIRVVVTCDPHQASAWGIPCVTLTSEAHAPVRFMAALKGAERGAELAVLVPSAVGSSEHDAQAAAVWLLDGLCAVLGAERPPTVLP